MSRHGVRHFVGLDLAQANAFTALALCEVSEGCCCRAMDRL